MATGKQPAESAPATAALDQPGSGAEISDCQRYRYALWRRWADGPAVLFVMLNPSTADARSDDPTIRRCIGFARSWDYAAVLVANLFALRTPTPADCCEPALRSARITMHGCGGCSLPPG